MRLLSFLFQGIVPYECISIRLMAYCQIMVVISTFATLHANHSWITNAETWDSFTDSDTIREINFVRIQLFFLGPEWLKKMTTPSCWIFVISWTLSSSRTVRLVTFTRFAAAFSHANKNRTNYAGRWSWFRNDIDIMGVFIIFILTRCPKKSLK